MWIKVSNKRYINTDTIRYIDIAGERASLNFSDSEELWIDIAGASYLLASVEAQVAITNKEPTPPSLKSRIAQALRYEYPNGAPLLNLLANLPDESRGTVTNAVRELTKERVVVVDKEADPPIYYHASNAPSSTLDPSDAIAGNW